MGSPSSRDGGTSEQREPVLVMVRHLLAQGRIEEVVRVVQQLLARNEQLERQRGNPQKNESVSRDQLLLLLNGLGIGPEVLAKADQQLREASEIDRERDEALKKKADRPRRKPFPPKLRRVVSEIRVPEAERACPKCGKERECIGHDVTEILELIPAELVVKREVKEKLACKPCEGELVRAPKGEKLVEGGRIGISVGAQVVTDKYRDGLPLNRQSERFERMGWDAPVSTLCDQVKWVCDLLRPLQRAAKKEVLRAEVMQLDATSVKVRDPTDPKVLRNGTLWGYLGRTGPTALVLYLYASTGKALGQRIGELGPQEILAERVGLTVADAASIFDASFKRPELIECGCNMHSRRKLVLALDNGDARAAVPLAAFKRMYEIEEEIRDRSQEEIRQERQARTKPIFDELMRWCGAYKAEEPPRTYLGKAVQYMLNHEVALRRFLDDGRIPMDNGAMERQHIRVALTRNAYLFAGSDEGAERAAIAYTVLGSCELADVNPVEYLNDVLPRLARGIREVDAAKLLPHCWKAARATPASTEAATPTA
jgi:transposase